MFKLCMIAMIGAAAATCTTTSCTYTDGHTHVFSKMLNDDGTANADHERWHCEKSGTSGCACTCDDALLCTVNHHHTSGYTRSFDHCEAKTSFTYSTAQHTTTLIGDGCLANSADDQIEYVQLTSNTATTLSGTVGYKPLHSGSWTMSNGVSVQCWHYADDRWDSSPILAKQDAGIGYGYGAGKGPSRTHAFIFTPRAATGTHYVRCGIIDRASATCNFDDNTHCGSNSAGSSTAHHYDNADVAFTM